MHPLNILCIVVADDVSNIETSELYIVQLLNVELNEVTLLVFQPVNGLLKDVHDCHIDVNEIVPVVFKIQLLTSPLNDEHDCQAVKNDVHDFQFIPVNGILNEVQDCIIFWADVTKLVSQDVKLGIVVIEEQLLSAEFIMVVPDIFNMSVAVITKFEHP